MRKKDSEKIVNNLIQFIKEKLLDNFKNQNGRVIDSVETLNILDFEIDDENEDRDKIIVTKVIAAARVWVKFVEDSKSSDNIQLRNNKIVEFVYNKETDEFEMVANDVVFYINSLY
jgi:flagellar biosynthesis regulator FlaF